MLSYQKYIFLVIWISDAVSMLARFFARNLSFCFLFASRSLFACSMCAATSFPSGSLSPVFLLSSLYFFFQLSTIFCFLLIAWLCHLFDVALTFTSSSRFSLLSLWFSLLSCNSSLSCSETLFCSSARSHSSFWAFSWETCSWNISKAGLFKGGLPCPAGNLRFFDTAGGGMKGEFKYSCSLSLSLLSLYLCFEMSTKQIMSDFPITNDNFLVNNISWDAYVMIDVSVHIHLHSTALAVHTSSSSTNLKHYYAELLGASGTSPVHTFWTSFLEGTSMASQCFAYEPRVCINDPLWNPASSPSLTQRENWGLSDQCWDLED